MSTATVHAGTPAVDPGVSAGQGRVTFPHLVRSEWIKFWTLRSTWWTLGLTVVAMVGMALIMAASVAAMISDDSLPPGDSSGLAPSVITFGYFLGQVTVAVLGALVVTGEYSTGMIRSTFSAAPRRTGALFAKASVLAVVVFVTGVVATLISYVVTNPILSSKSLGLDLSEGTSWRVILGNGVYLALVALFAFALGVLIRNGAGAIAAALGVFLMLPLVFQILTALSQKWALDLYPYLPGTAGERIMTVGNFFAMGGSDSNQLVWWQGGLVLLAYVVVLIGAGLAVVKSRDA